MKQCYVATAEPFHDAKTRERALFVKCPVCSVPPGTLCDVQGTLDVHHNRILLAARTVAQC